MTPFEKQQFAGENIYKITESDRNILRKDTTSTTPITFSMHEKNDQSFIESLLLFNNPYSAFITTTTTTRFTLATATTKFSKTTTNTTTPTTVTTTVTTTTSSTSKTKMLTKGTSTSTTGKVTASQDARRTLEIFALFSPTSTASLWDILSIQGQVNLSSSATKSSTRKPFTLASTTRKFQTKKRPISLSTTFPKPKTKTSFTTISVLELLNSFQVV